MSMAPTEGEHAPPVPPLTVVPDDLPIPNSQTRVTATTVRPRRVYTSLVYLSPVMIATAMVPTQKKDQSVRICLSFDIFGGS
jgi:hypothetical protein